MAADGTLGVAEDLRERAAAALRRGDAEAALAAYAALLEQAPTDFEALSNAAALHGQAGRLDAAAPLLARAAALRPHNAVVQANLAKLALERQDWATAERAARRATLVAPDLANGHNNLAVALKNLGYWDEAAAAVEAGLRRAPGDSGLLMLAGELAQRIGDIPAALAAFAMAEPAPVNGSALVAAGNYAGIPPAIGFAAHRAWAQRIEGAAAQLPAPPPPAEGRLRVGYVSPDFRDHSVAFFIEPVLAAHDRGAFELHAFSAVRRPDAVTGRLRALVGRWHEAAALSDLELARLVRAERIDILVDLAGHTVGNRLGAFALRAAPVQASWIGYPATTGLAAMDFRLTDAVADPEGAEAWHSERLVRLPQGFLCYRPPEDAPAVATAPPPRGGERPFAFGSFNALAKLGPAAIAAWGAILRRVPGAQLRLKAADLGGRRAQRRLIEAFALEGIAESRLKLLPQHRSRRDHLTTYAAVDLALDSFPYNGTTTTCEALWMGTPVLTLRGTAHAGRVGASLLGRLGLDELVADDVGAYCDRAVALAAAPQRLKDWRAGLRARMTASPLCRPELFVPALEAAYREMAAMRRRQILAAA
ncbi:MAG: hypothetical protein U1E53_10255 [Dongiaceae bacterium]